MLTSEVSEAQLPSADTDFLRESVKAVIKHAKFETLAALSGDDIVQIVTPGDAARVVVNVRVDDLPERLRAAFTFVCRVAFARTNHINGDLSHKPVSWPELWKRFKVVDDMIIISSAGTMDDDLFAIYLELLDGECSSFPTCEDVQEGNAQSVIDDYACGSYQHDAAGLRQGEYCEEDVEGFLEDDVSACFDKSADAEACSRGYPAYQRRPRVILVNATSRF